MNASDTMHWIIDHLNVTQEEKDEQHASVNECARAVTSVVTDEPKDAQDEPKDAHE